MTLYDSTLDDTTQEGGYEIAMALGRDKQTESVAFMDHEMGNIVEVPPEVALKFAWAIINNVRDPNATLN